MKILIVEDQQPVREIYAEILRSADFEIIEAEGYETAVTLIEQDIDIALLDIQLEGKSGIEVLAYIRDQKPECPVIMMSGYADKGNIIKAMRQGAVDYLEKPVNPAELIHCVEHWLDFRTLQKENQRLQDFQAIHERLQKNSEEIRLANERLNFLLTSTAAVIYAADLSNHCAITYVSENIRRLTGFDTTSFINDHDFRLNRIHPDDRERVKDGLKLGFERGHHRMEYRFQHLDGRYIWLGDELRIEENQRGIKEFFGFITDISRERANQEQIRKMAYTDLLTGLPNRSLYYDRLKQGIAQARRHQTSMGILFIDLDFFKPINDELGHEWGDAALIEIGHRLKESVREIDTVARIGGDEFSVVLVDLNSEEDARKIAEVIIKNIGKPMLLKNRSFVLGASIGIYLESESYSDAETYMRMADNAMYTAKESGRNCYHLIHGSQENQRIMEPYRLEMSLRSAISNDEFRIHYQPKFDVYQNRITGLHALLRWDRGEEGLLYPDQFLGLAAKTGLIVPIGEWVLGHVCAQNRDWQETGLKIVPISVNVTYDQLRLPGFAERIRCILLESELPASMLEVEISETELMQHSSAVTASLNDLDALGVKITINNFGSGFFSMQALKSMPIHELKLNRSLVHKIGMDKDSTQIAKAMINMGHILNRQVVAEGIESADQLNFLQENESDGMIGFFSSPPLPVDEIGKLLKKLDRSSGS